MGLLDKYRSYIRKENLFQQDDQLILAVSGGVDSVVLCELCKLAGYHFMIAHCNFQLRGEESERDEQFVRVLGKKYNVEVLVKRFDTETYAHEKRISIQVAARELRYDWFHQLDGRWILTAHHADDAIETMLMNFFKGTGINGLRGILPKQGKVARPLLFAGKDDIMAYAKERELAFVEDSSNASDKYTRNYFRNKLIPGIKEVFPQVEENLLDNLSRFREVDELYRQAVGLHKKKLLVQKGNETHIPVLKLAKTVPLHSIVYEIIREFDFTPHQADEVIGLLKSGSGKYIRSATHRIIRNRNWLIISPNATTEAVNILVESEGAIDFSKGKLTLRAFPADNHPLQTSGDIAELDASEIRFPLLLRKWKQGDYFYPLGMKKKKKLSRFLTDRKLSLTQKEDVWVLEMNKKILWVIGLRIDDRFRVNDKTKKILQVKFSAAE